MLFVHCRSGWWLSIYCREGNFVEISSYIVCRCCRWFRYLIRSSCYACLLWLPYSVAYFDVVLVEKGVVLVLLMEVFRYELKEGFADVSFHAAVIKRSNNNLLNKRFELVPKCRHENKFYLKNN